ncbi:MAG: hypothetical protein CMA54_03205 [Euryarchaeota archaeon]|nr:hypothetical protein [Euryarchaeota archaeon]
MEPVPGTYGPREAGASHSTQVRARDQTGVPTTAGAQRRGRPTRKRVPLLPKDHGPTEALRSHPGRCHSGGWEDRMDYEASAPLRGPATGPRRRRWPGTMEQESTLVVGRSGGFLLLVAE